jgi:hypothetical protein
VHPYLIAVAVLLLSTAGAYVSGRRDGQRIEQGKCLAKAAAVQEAAQIASQAAAEAIAGIKIENTTIRQKVEREIHTIPADCAVPDGVLELTNQALTGQEPSSGSVSGVDPDGSRDPG